MEYSYIILDYDGSISTELQKKLEEYEDFCCTCILDNTKDTLNNILKYKPDIVFIQLNDKANDSFHMVVELYQYTHSIPILIAVSKSEEHAYKAIKSSFYDYMLFPFNEFETRKTILRLKKKSYEDNFSKTICLKSYQDYRYIDSKDILYLKADNNATDFILKDGTIISAFKTLKTFEYNLPRNFIRIHQSYILNCNYVSRINYAKYICVLKCKQLQIPFSRSYKENMIKIKKKLTKNSIFVLN